MSSRSWVEVSRSRLQHNLTIIRELLSEDQAVIAVVKANAYGHGLDIVAPLLAQGGISTFGVADPQEGSRLRGLIPEADILVFGGCEVEDIEQFRRHRLTASLFDSRNLPSDIPVQVKINTGMGRLGVHWTRVSEFIASLESNVSGVFATLACADTDPEFTTLQIRRFKETTHTLPFRKHLSNSAGLQFSEAHFDAVRPGLALYGIATVPALQELQPALCWKTKIIAVNLLPENSTVGYGSTFSTQKASRIGVLGVGYADGYGRGFSNQGVVETAAGLAPIVGRVSMDLTMVDLTELPRVKEGDEVTLLSQHPEDPHSALNLARRLDTIPYEILTSIGPRVERVAVE